MFEWVVDKINQTLKVLPDHKFIGILDIAGFDMVAAKFRQHPKFSKDPRSNPLDFTISHYAGKVNYSCDSWIEYLLKMKLMKLSRLLLTLFSTFFEQIQFE